MDGMIIQHVRLGAIGCLADRSNSLVKILGIPYGTIDQRFARSKLSKDLSTQRGRYRNDIFDATNPGASSIQPWGSVKSDASNIPLPTDDLPEDEEQSEDCLNLSLYIPTSCFDNGNTIKTNEKLPVLVFLHGGAYFLGSANRPYYSPVGLMRHGIDRNSPFIFISINYRLGGLGFYHCPGAPDLVPPNNGLHDQLLALQWLRENLEGFGGDLDRVTIIGQSAGGESISLHAASGLQPPLYKRAIMLSGSPVTMPAKTPQEYGEIFYQEAEKMGIRVKDGETWRSAQEVAQAMIEIDVDEIRKAGFVGLPCTNTEMLPYERPIMEMMMTGDQAKKGWVEAAIVGSATYDGGISFDMIYRDKNRRDHARGFIKIAEEVLGPENAQELCDIYHLGHDTEDNEALKNICLFESDIGFFAAAFSMAQGASTPTYLQLFDLGNPFKGPLTDTFPGGSFSTHTFDIVTLLGGVHEGMLPQGYASVIKNWRDCILDFVVSGEPPCGKFDDHNRHALMVNEQGVREVKGADYLEDDECRRKRLLQLADAIAGNAGRDKLWVEVCRRWLMQGE